MSTQFRLIWELEFIRDISFQDSSVSGIHSGYILSGLIGLRYTFGIHPFRTHRSQVYIRDTSFQDSSVSGIHSGYILSGLIGLRYTFGIHPFRTHRSYVHIRKTSFRENSKLVFDKRGTLRFFASGYTLRV